MRKFTTIIIGGGQAGLATSYHLKQRGQEHIILEQAERAANAWRNDRWDSFVLNTPNWMFRLPGMEYAGDDPDGFMARQEVVTTFEQYIERCRLPVQYGARITAVESLGDEAGYRVQVNEDVLEARNVVVATGLYQQAKKPAFSTDLPGEITQLYSGQYRNPQALPPGAVLVAGSGQSGCQIVEDLYLSGRKVYLSVSGAGRVPRRYRGSDILKWLYMDGFMDRTPELLKSPADRFRANPQLSGSNGGHNINLHQFVRDGVTLLGRIQDGGEGKIGLAPDLKQNLERADRIEADILKQIDDFIAREGLEAPRESLPALRDGYEVEEISTLDLAAAGIYTIIWAMGYAFDFNMVRLPVCDPYGYPIQNRGVTGHPGLFFMGLPWLSKFKSGLLVGVGEDAEYIAEKITERERALESPLKEHSF